MSLIRTRWAAVGAAIAITLGAGGIAGVQASLSSGERAVYVPITPCRLIDTRPEFQVGTRATPLGAGETITLSTYGNNGRCTLPGDFNGLVLNVTAVGATLPTFLTIWPTGVAQPDASSLNPQPGAPPTPNAVTTKVSAAGQFNIYNLQGTVHVLADITGYYVDHTHDDRYYTEAEIDAWLDTPVADITSIPAAAFTPRYPESTDYTIASGAQLIVSATSVDDTFVAPIQLPDGAVLSGMSVSMWDDSTTSLAVYLYRIPFATPFFDPIFGVVSSGDAAGVQIVTDSVAASDDRRLVDNGAYTYLLWVESPGSWASAHADLRLHGITVSYTW